MTAANFLIMRWGLSNEADLYLDNIIFYDEDGNSIPIVNEPIEVPEGEEAPEEAPVEETSAEQ